MFHKICLNLHWQMRYIVQGANECCSRKRHDVPYIRFKTLCYPSHVDLLNTLQLNHIVSNLRDFASFALSSSFKRWLPALSVQKFSLGAIAFEQQSLRQGMLHIGMIPLGPVRRRSFCTKPWHFCLINTIFTFFCAWTVFVFCVCTYDSSSCMSCTYTSDEIHFHRHVPYKARNHVADLVCPDVTFLSGLCTFLACHLRFQP